MHHHLDARSLKFRLDQTHQKKNLKKKKNLSDQKIDQTHRSQETFRYFGSLQTEFWTAKRLNFRAFIRWFVEATNVVKPSKVIEIGHKC